MKIVIDIDNYLYDSIIKYKLLLPDEVWDIRDAIVNGEPIEQESEEENLTLDDWTYHEYPRESEEDNDR